MNTNPVGALVPIVAYPELVDTKVTNCGVANVVVLIIATLVALVASVDPPLVEVVTSLVTGL